MFLFVTFRIPGAATVCRPFVLKTGHKIIKKLRTLYYAQALFSPFCYNYVKIPALCPVFLFIKLYLWHEKRVSLLP